MKKNLNLIVVILFVVVAGGLGFAAVSSTAPDPQSQAIASQVIAREKASVEAWQRKDKTFWADFLTDDATYFGSQNPYLETDPKVNFLPKFEQYAEQFKIIDFQMYNPRVQVYGDVAILAYNNAATVSIGGQVINYTGKVTSVYVKQGNTWRVAHGHESMNPGAK
jgi:ketosteroid isomerase-like protein